MDIFKKILPLIIVIILSVPIIRPLFLPGFFPMHDDTQPTRIFELSKALHDGEFPVRWVPDLGYGFGYPIFNFYAPLPYYFGAVILLLGLSAIVAAKIMFGVGLLAAGISMYLLGNKLWGKLGGILGAIFYVYAPYHAVQIYVRGAVGESWAYAFLPLVFLGIIRGKERISRWGIILGAIGFSGVILSHNVTALLTGGFIALWLIVAVWQRLRNKQNFFLLQTIYIVILGLGLSAWFWLPAVTEAHYTNVSTLSSGTNDYHNHFIYPDQLWDSPWGYGGSAPGRADGMSFKIGKLQLVTALAVIIWLLWQRKKSFPTFAAYTALGLGVSVWLMLPNSVWMWEITPISSYIQYPWRLLAFCLLFTSVLSGGVINIIHDLSLLLGVSCRSSTPKITLKRGTRFLGFPDSCHPLLLSGKQVTGLLLVLLTVYLNLKYFQPHYPTAAIDADYVSETAMKWNISKISDEYLPINFPIPRQLTEVAGDKISSVDDIIVENLEIKPQFIKAVVSANNAAEIVFSVAAFPGWNVVVDTKPVVPYIKAGKLAVIVPPGKHLLTAYFGDTLVRTAGNIISLVSLTVLFSVLGTINLERKNEKK